MALFALAGMLAGPVAGVLLLAGSQLLFGSRLDAEPGLLPLLGRVFDTVFDTRFTLLVGPIGALMLGGAVFGAGFLGVPLRRAPISDDVVVVGFVLRPDPALGPGACGLRP